MSWLTFKRVLLSSSASAVRRSVAINAAVERPRGASHFASSFWRCSGDDQIARWSRRIFFKNFRSSDGVGDGCGPGGVLVGVCANALDMPAMMMARSAVQRDELKQTIARGDLIV